MVATFKPPRRASSITSAEAIFAPLPPNQRRPGSQSGKAARSNIADLLRSSSRTPVRSGGSGAPTRARPASPASVARARFGPARAPDRRRARSEEHTSELQSRGHLVCRLLLEKKNAAHRLRYGLHDLALARR